MGTTLTRPPFFEEDKAARERPRAPEAAVERILLVGPMAAGKSSVGQALARLMGWELADIDKLVEAERGMSVAEIFREHGERVFRHLEARLTAEALTRDGLVIATGGGWPAGGHRRLTDLPSGTLSVWLQTEPETALRRIMNSTKNPGGKRPLLMGPDPETSLNHLAKTRAPYYGQAHLTIDTEDRTVPELATMIALRVNEAIFQKEHQPRPSTAQQGRTKCPPKPL